MGARLNVPHGAPAGHDIDMFDAFCEHLLVRAPGTGGKPGLVIGTYRVLTPDSAKRVGGLYSDTEFDLTRLRPLRPTRVAPVYTRRGALAARSWPCGALWPNSWCATSWTR
jgi:putative hemolysin